MFVQYYHGMIRKYVMAFGNLFNDIVIQRLDADGNRVSSLLVPLAYGPKESWLVRLAQDPNLEREVQITVPRMGFEIVTMAYDPTRKLSSTIKNVRLKTSDFDRVDSQFVPVPYNFNMLLSVFVRNADDGAQIVEQIVPYFRPEFTTQVNDIPDMGITRDVPVVLQDVSIEDTYEGDFETRRALVYNLNFVLKGYLYGPVTDSGLIKRTITNFFDGVEGDAPKLETMTITPSLWANGEPLHSPSSNSAHGVALDQISGESDYGFTTVIDIETFGE